MTARQLADKLGWDVNTTSSQLNRLQQQALVEKVEPAKGKRAAFQIGERFLISGTLCEPAAGCDAG